MLKFGNPFPLKQLIPSPSPKFSKAEQPPIVLEPITMVTTTKPKKESKPPLAFGTSELSDVLGRLHDFNSIHSTGLAFTIVMRNKAGLLEVYERVNQPCYGELRKYTETHGEDCTRPGDRRPGDLCDPFPEGTPEAIGISWNSYIQIYKETMKSDGLCVRFIKDVLFGLKSPWIKGFGSPDNIEWTIKNGYLYGFVLKNTEIDPTVLVSLLKRVQTYTTHSQYNGDDYTAYLGAGLSEFKALISCLFLPQLPYVGGGIVMPDGYSLPMYASYRRIKDQNPKDLTGGTLRNRWDYNRKDLAKLFASDTEQEGTCLVKELKTKLNIPTGKYVWPIGLKEYVPLAKEIIVEGLKK